MCQCDLREIKSKHKSNVNCLHILMRKANNGIGKEQFFIFSLFTINLNVKCKKKKKNKENNLNLKVAHSIKFEQIFHRQSVMQLSSFTLNK